jgi:hypothetical protein
METDDAYNQDEKTILKPRVDCRLYNYTNLNQNVIPPTMITPQKNLDPSQVQNPSESLTQVNIIEIICFSGFTP